MKQPSRSDAQESLKKGTAPTTKVSSVGVQVLSLLHRLASTPANAEDALKLLHELQVHQVELDMQLEQIEAYERELAEDRDAYKTLFDLAPAGYFRVGAQGNVIAANRAGAELFGADPDTMRGRAIDSFVEIESRPAILGLLDRLRKGSSRETCLAMSDGGDQTARQLRVVASATPGCGTFLLLFIDTADHENSDKERG